jgi:hypothetical protein
VLAHFPAHADRLAVAPFDPLTSRKFAAVRSPYNYGYVNYRTDEPGWSFVKGNRRNVMTLRHGLSFCVNWAPLMCTGRGLLWVASVGGLFHSGSGGSGLRLAAVSRR